MNGSDMTRESLGTRVNYQRLKDLIRADIVAGEYPSGSRLKIPALCDRYGASAIPVREALQGLSGEGLVVIMPNRGATVRVVDAAFMEDIYEIRKVLEAFIARRFVATAGDSVLETLHAIQRQMEACEDAKDMLARHKCDIQFHRTIAGAIDNSEVGLIVDRHTNIIDAVMRQFGQSPLRIAQVRSEHRELLEAFRQRNADQAEEIAQRHFNNARLDMSALMRMSSRSQSPAA